MTDHYTISGKKTMLLAGVLASGILVSVGKPQSADPAQTPAPAATPARTAQPVATGTPAAAAAPARAPYRNHSTRFQKRATLYYESLWGVDSLAVKTVESGEMVRFSYRVTDPDRAQLLHDKKLEPSLIDPHARVSLVVPKMEKVGQLRQTGTPEAGRSYWMAFSNAGRMVKRGDRVDVVIGQFRATGLVVE